MKKETMALYFIIFMGVVAIISGILVYRSTISIETKARVLSEQEYLQQNSEENPLESYEYSRLCRSCSERFPSGNTCPSCGSHDIIDIRIKNDRN